MLMKYFTFTSICLLTFCMLLALSGTTDLPADYLAQINGQRPDNHGPLSSNKGIKEITKKKSSEVSFHVSTADIMENKDEEVQQGGQGYHRQIINLFGILFLVVWVFLSLKLLSVDLPNKPEG